MGRAGSSSEAVREQQQGRGVGAAAVMRCGSSSGDMAWGQQQRRGAGAAAATWCGSSSSDVVWEQQQRRNVGSSSRCGVVRAAAGAVRAAAGTVRCRQQQVRCGAGSSSGTLSISSTSTALQKITNLRGLQKTCNKNLALLALSGLTSEMARHWQGTGKSKMRKSWQVTLHFADVQCLNDTRTHPDEYVFDIT